MIKINYESDFKLTEKAEDGFADVPFRFVYSSNSGTYMASYDGEKYTNCKRNEDGSVTVIFNKHGLGVGRLKVRREFFIPDRDFSDGVYNVVSNDTTDVILVEGKTDGYNVEETFQPPYIGGGGTIVTVEVVDSLDSDASDKALSARQGKVLKGMIPTDYITEIPDTLADKSYVDNAVLNKADKTEVEALGKEVATKQDELTLTVLDDGNIRIGNLQGQTKDFMPATPSGDPMHNLYISAGAEYNVTGADITKTTPWGESVTHKAGYWYLNGLGDLGNKEMCDIIEAGRLLLDVAGRYQNNIKIRTNLPLLSSGQSGHARALDSRGMFSNATNIEVILLSTINYTNVPNGSLGELIATATSLQFTFSSCINLNIIATILDVNNITSFSSTFTKCLQLKTCYIKKLKASVSFADSPNFSAESIHYIIQNAVGGTASAPITITLHTIAKANWESSAYYTEDLTKANELNITIA